MISPKPKLEMEELRIESRDPAVAKAEHRQQSQQTYQSLPLPQRVLIAVSMVVPATRGKQR